MLEYLLPDNLSIEALRKQLEGYAPLRPGPDEQTHRLFFDSFDWRLYQRNLILEEVSENDSSRLQLRKLGSRRPLAQLAGRAPRFSQELLPGSLRQALADILDMRCLFPLAGAVTRSHPLAVLDQNRKTVVRMAIDEHQIGSAQMEPPHRREVRLRLLPVRGYEKQMLQLDQYVRDALGLAVAEQDLWQRAMAAAERHPGDYSSKLKLDLDPAQAATGALCRILLRLFDTMERNLDGTRRDFDTEFLHDFRVAIRRTRAVLGQFKDVLPPLAFERFRSDFAWLGSLTGRTRDLDVYLLHFDLYRDTLPSEQQKDLVGLYDFLIEQQRAAQRTLAEALDSQRFRRLFDEWRKLLESSVAETDSTGPPLLDVVNQRIAKLFEQSLKEGSAITEHSPAEELHRLRKSGKKLRYLLEFFQCLYPPKKISKLIKALKGLQENLGEFQDIEVHSRDLCDFSRNMNGRNSLTPQTLLAMGMLMGNLRQRQNRIRSEFAVRFSAFAATQNRRLFRQLFGKGTQTP